MSVTFVLVRAASPHVIDYSEVGGRDGVGAATAVTVAAAQAAPWGSLCVDAAGAAAALWRDGWGCTVPIWDILWLPKKNKTPHTHTGEWGQKNRGINPRPAHVRWLTTIASSFSVESWMVMRSISWFRPSMLLRNRGADDFEMGMGIRMVLGIGDYRKTRQTPAVSVYAAHSGRVQSFRCCQEYLIPR